jgi:hypothetical protein
MDIGHDVHPGVCATSPHQATLQCLSAEYFCSFHSFISDFFLSNLITGHATPGRATPLRHTALHA